MAHCFSREPDVWQSSLGKTNVVSKMNANTTDSEINTDNT